MKIMFVTEKSLNECNPELVEKLLNTTSFYDVCEVIFSLLLSRIDLGDAGAE